MRVLMLEYWNSGAQRLHRGEIVEVNDGVGTALILTRRAIAADTEAVRECAAILAGQDTAPAAPTANTARAAEILRQLKRQRLTGPVVATTFRR